MRVPKIYFETIDRNGIRAKFRWLFLERWRQLLFCSMCDTIMSTNKGKRLGLDSEQDLLFFKVEGWWSVNVGPGTLPWTKWPTSWSPCTRSSSHACDCPRSRREIGWTCFCMIAQHREREDSKDSWTDEQISWKKFGCSIQMLLDKMMAIPNYNTNETVETAGHGTETVTEEGSLFTHTNTSPHTLSQTKHLPMTSHG